MINNIIKDKYEVNEGYLGLVIYTIGGEGDETKIELWYELTTKFNTKSASKRLSFSKDTDDTNKLTYEYILRVEYGVDI